MFNYQINTLPTGQEQIIRTDENGQVWYIPADPANSDYQAYLATLASELSNSSTPKAGE